MLAVSDAWKATIRDSFRQPAYLKYIVSSPDPSLGYVILASAATNTLAPSTDDKLFNRANSEINLATFEQNYWKLDGSFQLPPESPTTINTLGWWGTEFSDTINSSLVTSSFELDMDTNSFINAPNILIAFYEGYAVDFTVTYKTSGSPLVAYTITGNTNQLWQANYPFVLTNSYNQIVINITKWSLPGRHPRVLYISLGLKKEFHFGSSLILTSEEKKSVSYLSAKLPSLTTTFTIDNREKLLDILSVEPDLTSGELVEQWWGYQVNPAVIEWISSGKYFLDSWSVDSNALTATLSASSVLSLATERYYGISGYYYDWVISDMLLDLKLPKINGHDPWDDNALYLLFSCLTTVAPIPVIECNQILQYIAEATCCVLDTDPSTGWIRFRTISSTLVYPTYLLTPPTLLIPSTLLTPSITVDVEKSKPQVTLDPEISQIVVKVSTYATDTSMSEIAKYAVTATVDTLDDYSDYYFDTNIDSRFENVIISLKNVSPAGTLTIEYESIYNHKLSVYLTGALGSTADLVLEGHIVVQNQTDYIIYTNLDCTSGQPFVIDNPLITDIVTAQKVGDFALAYLQNRALLTIDYNGDPSIEPMDIYAVDIDPGDPFSDPVHPVPPIAMTTMITDTDIKYSGAWDGTISGRKVVLPLWVI